MLEAHGSDIPLERFVARVDSHPAQLALIRAGVGIGVTNATDKVTLKLLLSKDLN